MTSPDQPAAPVTPWTKHQRQGEIEVRPWTRDDADRYYGEEFRDGTISVSQADHPIARNLPPVGYVARNPDKHSDQWYIAPDYFAKHYGPLRAPSASAAALTEDAAYDAKLCEYMAERLEQESASFAPTGRAAYMHDAKRLRTLAARLSVESQS